MSGIFDDAIRIILTHSEHGPFTYFMAICFTCFTIFILYMVVFTLRPAAAEETPAGQRLNQIESRPVNGVRNRSLSNVS